MSAPFGMSYGGRALSSTDLIAGLPELLLAEFQGLMHLHFRQESPEKNEGYHEHNKHRANDKVVIAFVCPDLERRHLFSRAGGDTEDRQKEL